jgi:hypothetical protein
MNYHIVHTNNASKGSYIMKYFRFKGKDDLWLGKFGKSERTLIPNELLTQKELDRIKKDCPRLSVDKTFKEIELSPNKTYTSFGVRFEDGTDHNSKLESTTHSRKLHIKESDDTTVILKNMNTDVIPVVDFGCYGGPLSYALEDVFVWDAVNLDAFEDSEYYDEVAELIDNRYDGTSDFYEQVLRYAPSTIQDALNEYGVDAHVISGTCKWNHPREYNYSDDCIEFDMRINTSWVKFKFAELSKKGDFRKFIRDNFSSRSGFISFIPNDVDDYDALLNPSNPEYWKVVSAIIQYMIDEDTTIREDATEDLIDDILSNPSFERVSAFD